MKISILTPTYNRANLLKNLYKSILENCTKCNLQVEWLIMDDGSKDETKLMVERFISDKKLEIKYFYQENSGKMQGNQTGCSSNHWFRPCKYNSAVSG